MAETKVDGYTVRGYFEQSPIIPLYHVTNSGKEATFRFNMPEHGDTIQLIISSRTDSNGSVTLGILPGDLAPAGSGYTLPVNAEELNVYMLTTGEVMNADGSFCIKLTTADTNGLTAFGLYLAATAHVPVKNN